MRLYSLLIALHLLAAIVWIGGMFFAHQVLRPVAASQLEPPLRLPLWVGVFRRFFPWVWLAVLLLPASGYWLSFGLYGGLGQAPLYVHLMHGIGWLMILLYGFVYFRPFQVLKARVVEKNWPEAAEALAVIRKVVGLNLVLGLLVAVIAAGGRLL